VIPPWGFAIIAVGVVVLGAVIGVLLWRRRKQSKMDDTLSRAQIVMPGFHSTMLNSEAVDTQPGKPGLAVFKSTRIEMQPPNLSTVNVEHEVYQGADIRVSLLAFFDRFDRSYLCGYDY
jgi:hypothetical protein